MIVAFALVSCVFSEGPTIVVLCAVSKFHLCVRRSGVLGCRNENFACEKVTPSPRVLEISGDFNEGDFLVISYMYCRGVSAGWDREMGNDLTSD